MDNATDVHVYNNLKLMTDFAKKSIKVGKLTLNRVSLGQNIV